MRKQRIILLCISVSYKQELLRMGYPKRLLLLLLLLSLTEDCEASSEQPQFTTQHCGHCDVNNGISCVTSTPTQPRLKQGQGGRVSALSLLSINRTIKEKLYHIFWVSATGNWKFCQQNFLSSYLIFFFLILNSCKLKIVLATIFLIDIYKASNSTGSWLWSPDSIVNQANNYKDADNAHMVNNLQVFYCNKITLNNG